MMQYVGLSVCPVCLSYILSVSQSIVIASMETPSRAKVVQCSSSSSWNDSVIYTYKLEMQTSLHSHTATRHATLYL